MKYLCLYVKIDLSIRKEVFLLEKIAVIDLGSNSVRMSVFGVEGNLAKTLGAYRSTIRLSEGMTADMMLSAEAQLRAVRALAGYKNTIECEGIKSVVAVATAAVRKAKNRDEFIKLVKDSTGLEIRVIDGTQEAALDCLAVSRTLGCERGVICDIGGGSTELIGVSAGVQSDAVSIPFGSRGICEMFFKDGETPEAIARAEEFVREKYENEDWLAKFRGAAVVGIGGTLRAAAKFDLGDSTAVAIEKYVITPERMTEIINEILSTSVDERKKMVGIGEERADIILGGLIFIKCLAEVLSPKEFVIADVGVREVALFDILEKRNIL